MNRSWVDETRDAAQGQWRTILSALGIEVPPTSRKHGPCPGCGGKDRFRFDDKQGRGTFLCSTGGGEPIAGDGFSLIQHVHACQFLDAARQVANILGVDPQRSQLLVPTKAQQISRHRVQVSRMLKEDYEKAAKVERAKKAIESTLLGCKPLQQVPAVWKYLTESRGIPAKYLKASDDLVAHPGLEYYWKPTRDQPSHSLGIFPALIGVCRSLTGEIMTLHRTYLSPHGQKLALPDPKQVGDTLPARKLMGTAGDHHYVIPMFQPLQERLGVSEGIETALSAAILNDLPAHAAIDSGKLIHFSPPLGVHTLFIFADDDPAGRHSAESLKQRLAIERRDMRVSIRYPRQMGAMPGMDWNDLLLQGAPQKHLAKPKP